MRNLHRVNNSDWSDAVIRAGQVTGAPFEQSDPQLQYGVEVDSLTQPEYWWLKRGGLYTYGGVQAAVAGQVGAMEIRVTPGRTDAIGIIDHVIVSAGAATGMLVQVKAGVLGPYSSGSPADDRLGTRPSQLEASVAATAVALGFTAGAKAVLLAANTPVLIPGPWVITGNLVLLVGGNTANVQVAFAAQWRERTKSTQEA